MLTETKTNIVGKYFYDFPLAQKKGLHHHNFNAVPPLNEGMNISYIYKKSGTSSPPYPLPLRRLLVRYKLKIFYLNIRIVESIMIACIHRAHYFLLSSTSCGLAKVKCIVYTCRVVEHNSADKKNIILYFTRLKYFNDYFNAQYTHMTYTRIMFFL